MSDENLHAATPQRRNSKTIFVKRSENEVADGSDSTRCATAAAFSTDSWMSNIVLAFVHTLKAAFFCDECEHAGKTVWATDTRRQITGSYRLTEKLVGFLSLLCNFPRVAADSWQPSTST